MIWSLNPEGVEPPDGDPRSEPYYVPINPAWIAVLAGLVDWSMLEPWYWEAADESQLVLTLQRSQDLLAILLASGPRFDLGPEWDGFTWS